MRRTNDRLRLPAVLLAVCGHCAGIRAQETGTPPASLPAPPEGAQTVSSPAAPPASPAPSTPATPGAGRLAFNFKNTPWDQVLDFLARETGLPLIREADLPQAPVTYISGTDYELDEAIDIVNRMLRMHGLQVRRQDNYLFLSKMKDMAALGGRFIGDVPASAPGAEIVTVVLPLQNAQAASLAERLKPLVSEFGGLTALPQQNTLILVDSAEQCRRLREIVSALDAEAPADAEVRVFPLRHAEASAVFGALKGLVAEKRTMVIVDKDGQQRTVQDESIQGLNLQPDARTNAIVAVGPAARLAVVEQLVTLLDAPDGGAGGRELLTFALGAASADDAARALTQLFAGEPEKRRPTVLALSSQGKVSVAGTPAQLAQAGALVADLDPGSTPLTGGTTGAGTGEARAVLLPLEHATPAGVQQVLTALLSARQSSMLRMAPAPGGRGLLVAGPAADVDLLRQLVAGIDVPPDLDREVRQIRLSSADGPAALRRAQELYGLTDRAASEPVTALLDEPSRTVSLVGGARALTAFTQLLATVEANAPLETETRSFDLASTRPSDAAPRIERLARVLLESPGGAPYVPPKLEPIDETGTLIVRAQPEQFGVLEELVRRVDRPGADARSLRVVRASVPDLAGLVARAQELYRAQTEGLPTGEAGGVEAQVDGASVLITGGARGLDRFTGILRELLQAAPPAPTVRLFPLQRARAAEVAAFLRELDGASRPMAAGGEVAPVIEAIEATNGVLVAAQPAQLGVIEALVHSMDSRRTGEAQPLRILRLRTTDAANLAQVLGESYARRPAEEQARRPVDIQADPATNTLLVAAHPDAFSEIERVVAELNETQGANASGREIRIFPLAVARADDLARTIDQMYPEPPTPLDPRTRQPRPDLRPAREIVVRADAGTNALIVDAPVQRMAGFEQLVQQLDRQQPPAPVELRTYRVQRAGVETIASALRALAASNGLGAPATARAAIVVTAEPVTRTLAVSGPAEIFPAVEQLLSEMDAPAERPPTVLRMYPLQHARAERLQPLLQPLLASRLRERLEREGTPADDARALLDVSADAATNTLLIAAPEYLHALVEELVRTLDSPAADAGRSLVRILPLSFADASQAAQTLNAALPSMTLPSGAGRVTVAPVGGSNALLLTGSAKDLEKLEELVRALDVRPMSEDSMDVRTFALANADAGTVAPLVERLLADQQQTDPRILSLQLRYARGPLPKVPQVRVQAEPRTNALVVSGPAATMDLAASIIERLDQPAQPPDRVLRTFTPARADPGRLVSAVLPLASAAAPPGRRPLELTAVPGTGVIVAMGTEEQAAEALRMLREFDERTPAAPEVEVRLLPLSHADATGVARVLSPMLSDRARWPAALRDAERAGFPVVSPVVSPDAEANRVLVSAPGVLMPLAVELVRTLDQPSARDARDVRVYTLRRSEAESVAAGLRTALEGARPAGEAAPTVTPVAASNAVVVTAGPGAMARADAVVRELDETAQPQNTGVRTVFLRHARAEAIEPVARALLERPTVFADLPVWARGQYAQQAAQELRGQVRVAAERRLNAIVVSGPSGMVELAEQMIRELDADPAAAGGARARTVQVLPLTSADAAEVAETIRAMFVDDTGTDADPAPTVRVDGAANALVVRATPAQHEAIAGLVRTLDASALAGVRELRMIPVDRARADAGVMAATLRRLLEQRGGLTVEVIPAEELLRRTAPAAPPAREPDRQGGDARWRRGAPLPFTSPPAMLVGAVLAQPVPDGLPSPQEPAAGVTIAVDPVTNSLIVVGPPRAIERIARLAGELERQLPPEPGTIRVVSLPDGADARAVASIVSATVAQVGQSGTSNPGGFTGRVLVQADPDGGALIVSANDTDFRALTELIGALARPASAAALTVRVYPLANTTPMAAMRAVADLVSPAPRGQQARRLRALDMTVEAPDHGAPVRGTLDPASIRVTADPGGGALIVAAPASSLDLIDRFVALIDQAPAAGRVAIRRFELRNAKADEAARTLQAAFDGARRPTRDGEIPPARFVADARTNALLITAPDAQMREAERLLADLDAPLADDGTRVVLIPLQVARPSAVQRIVEAVIVGRDPGRRERIQMSAADDSNLFVFRGTPEQIEDVRRIVSEADRAETGALPVRSVKLERADAQAVASALQQFFEDRARAAARPGTRPPQRQVSIIGDRRTGTIVVAASDADFEQVSSLLTTFDAPATTRDVQLKVVPLKHARVSDVRGVVERTTQELSFPPMFWMRAQAGNGGQAPDTLLVDFDERANAVVLIGQGEHFGTLERLIATLDQPAAEGARMALRAIRLEHADPRVVGNAIQAAMNDPSWRPWRGQDPGAVRAEVDARTRTLILVGREERLDLAASYARELDAGGADAGRTIESIPLRFAAADRVASSLQRFFRERAEARGMPGTGVSIIGSADGNVLLVGAGAEDMAIVRGLLAQMDQPEDDKGRVRELFQLRNADAAELAATLREHFPRALAGREGLVLVTPQASTNSVLVSAPDELSERVAALVRELDAAPVDAAARMVTVALSTSRADDVAASLTAALPRNVKIKITPVRRTNSLLLTGSDEAVALVLEQVRALDASPSRSPVEFRRRRLEHAVAADIAGTLRQLTARRPAGAGPAEAAPAITSSAQDNTLLLSATADQLAELERMIAELDVPAVVSRTTEFVALRHADPEQTADALRVFYGRFAPEAATPGARNVTIIASPASRSLVISAEAEQWEGIHALLAKLDSEEYDNSRRLEIFPLRNADAPSVARALAEAFQAPLRAELERERARRAESRRPGDDWPDVPRLLVDAGDTVTVSAEPRTNAVIVSAPREHVERIRAVITLLDAPDAARLGEARVIPLRHGTASVVASALRQAFAGEGLPGGPRSQGPRAVIIVGEDRSNTLIVRADDADFARIRALADTMQQEGDRTRVQVRVLPLRNVPAARLAQTVRAAFASVAAESRESFGVEVDRAANALVVASSETVFEQVRATVAELDAIPSLAQPPGPSSDRVTPGLGQGVYVLDLQNVAPADMQRTLDQLGVGRVSPPDRPGIVSEPVVVVPLASRRAIAVVAGPADARVLESLVRTLDVAPTQPDQVVAVVRLKTAVAGAVVSAMEELLRTAQQDGDVGAARALAEQVRRLSIQRDGIDQAALALDLTRPVRIFAEAQTNAVIIASTRENVDALTDFVAMLDRLPVGDAVVVRLFPLKNAAASRVAGVVREIYAQADRLRQNPNNPVRGEPTTQVGKGLVGQVAVTVDDRTNTLIVAGREEGVALVEVLVGQLDSDGAASWVEPRLIPLRHADPRRLATLLRQALVDGLRDSPEASALQRAVGRIAVRLAQPEGGDGRSKIDADLFTPLSSLVVLPVEHASALLVVASTANLAAISELVTLLDVPSAAASNTVRVYPLQFAAADRVSGMLQSIFRQQLASGVLRPEDDIAVVSDARTNALVVSSSERSFAIVETLLRNLDGEGMNPAVGLHVVPVTGSSAALLAPKIQQLMRERIESAARAGGVASPRDAFAIQAEPETNALIVTASEENAEIVRRLVATLSAGAETLGGAEVVDVVPVRSARVGEIAGTVRELYADRENRRRGSDSVRVTADQRLNALVVSGTAGDVEAVRALVGRLDSTQPDAVREIRKIELKKQDASELVQLLRGVLAGPSLAGVRGGPARETTLRFLRDSGQVGIDGGDADVAEAEISGTLADQVSLTAETRTNSIVVVAPARLLALIESMIADFDSSAAGARTVEIFELKNADARATAEVLRELFNLRQQGSTLVLAPQREPIPAGADGPPAGLSEPSLFPTFDERQQLAITIDARTNALLVSGTREYLDEVRKVVSRLDAREVNERERIVYPLRNARAGEIATVLRSYFQEESDRVRQTLGADRVGSLASQLEREVTVQGDEKSNRLLVSVSPRYSEAVSKIIAELDATPPQVVIQVLLAEVTLDEGAEWGVDFSVGPFGGEDYTIGSLGGGLALSTALGVPNITVSSTDFELLIRALESQGRLQVLSNPKVAVKNNERARIQVGENVAIVTGVERLDNGNTRSDVERQDLGIILNVTPSVSPDGFVRMEITPEISSLTNRTTQISEDFQAPVISRREVDTTITVRDGETIAIGGLIQSTSQERHTKVPLLGDIPLVGEVFRTHEYSTAKTELLVLLTPRIVDYGSTPTEGIRALRRITDHEIDRLSEPQEVREMINDIYAPPDRPPLEGNASSLPPPPPERPADGPRP